MNNAPPPTLDRLNVVFSNVVSTLLALGGLILFFMVVSSGLKYLMSGGDPKAAEGAKKTFTYAIGGVVLLIFSFMILRLIGVITGATDFLINFNVVR